MSAHVCPMTVGELLALYAITKARGNERLAAKVLDHSRLHEDDRNAPAVEPLTVDPHDTRMEGEGYVEWCRRIADRNNNQAAKAEDERQQQ